MYPTIEAVAHTLRTAIAKGRLEGSGGTALLDDLDLGLQVLSALARGSDGGLGAIDHALLPGLRTLPGATVPGAGAGPFEDYVRLRTGDTSLRIDAVERISGGFSRDMILLRCSIDGGTREIVLRREVPGGLLEGIGVDVAGEYPLMRIAQSGGVPVAAPLWLESDPMILGERFVAMECAAGACLGTSLGASSMIGEPQLRALAAMLAQLHRSDWRELASTTESQLSPANAANALLDRWESYWRATPMPDSPLLDQAMGWLRDHLPIDGLQPCLTHGDVGFHNIMADDQGFTALLDWEMAVVASPAKDIAHIRPSVDGMVEWEQFVGWYREAGGAVIGGAELHWFELFRAFSMTLVCHVALAKLSDPAAARIEYFKLGFVALPVFSEQLAGLLSPGQRSGS